MPPNSHTALIVSYAGFFILALVPILKPILDQFRDTFEGPVPSVEWPSWKPGDPCPIEIHGIGPSTKPRGTPDDQEYIFDSMKTVHEALMQCDNIRGIYLNVPSRTCFNGSDGYALLLSQLSGVKYGATPEVLSLDGHIPESCFWDNSFPAINWLRRWREWQIWNIWNVVRPKSNLEMWLDAVDLSRIHTMHLNITHLLSQEAEGALATSLPSLHTLVVQGKQSSFLLALPRNSLTHLTWHNMYTLHDNYQTLPTPVLQHLGSSLLILDIRIDETTKFPTHSLPNAQLRELTELVPNLTHLTLNLDRRQAKPRLPDKTWPWEDLKIIAKGLPELTHLTIHFELPSACRRRDSAPIYYRIPKCGGVEQYAKPMVGVRAAEEMVAYLGKHKAGKKLESVSFRSGDWKDPREDHEYEWIDGRRVWVDCARQGGKGEGKMKCEGGDTLNLNECWSEYRCIGACDDEKGLKIDYWTQVCPGDKVPVFEEEVVGSAGVAAGSTVTVC